MIIVFLDFGSSFDFFPCFCFLSAFLFRFSIFFFFRFSFRFSILVSFCCWVGLRLFPLRVLFLRASSHVLHSKRYDCELSNVWRSYLTGLYTAGVSSGCTAYCGYCRAPHVSQTLHCSPGPGFCSTSPASNSKYRTRSAGSSDSITKNPGARADAIDIGPERASPVNVLELLGVAGPLPL